MISHRWTTMLDWKKFLLIINAGSVVYFSMKQTKIKKPQIIDLCDKLESGKDYLFPTRFNGIKSKRALVKELKLSSIRSGFPIDIRNSKVEHQCKVGVEHELYISCLAGIKYTKTDKK